MNFGNNLKRLRLSKGYTQEQTAHALNISAKAVSRWECGTTMPDVMLLPDIAKLYCVTVDDLFKEKSIAYENYAQRLMSVYEQSHNQNDFIEADREFNKLIKSGNYTMKDICIYGILYQFHTSYCRNKALELFQKGLDMGESNDPDTYHWIERQRMHFLSGLGKDKENIELQQKHLDANPENLYAHINLAVAYFLADENEKALDLIKNARQKFGNDPILYIYEGDIYRRLKLFEKAFDCWDKSIENGITFSAPLHSKASCYEELGEYQKAYEVWCEIVSWYEEKGFEIEAEEPRKNAARCKAKS